MSVLDAPPGLLYAGRAAGEFSALRKSEKLSRRVFVLCSFLGALAIAISMRRFHRPGAEFFFVFSLVAVSIAFVGFAVRAATLRIGRDGIRWGWKNTGFSMGPDRIASITCFKDAVAIEPKKGSTWYVSARDWEGFSQVRSVIRDAELEYSFVDERAPLAARLQSYGLALDLLLVGDAIASVFLVLLAWGWAS